MNFFSARPFNNINREPENESNIEQEGPFLPNDPFFNNDSGPFLHPVPPAFDNFFGNDKEQLPDGGNSFLNFFGNAGNNPAAPEQNPTGIFGNDNELTGRTPFAFTEYGTVSPTGHASTADDAISGYHFLDLVPGVEYQISVFREEGAMDAAMWVFEGHRSYQDFVDDGQLSGDAFTSSSNWFIDYKDDSFEPELEGPAWDPRTVITAPETGQVTVVATEYASGAASQGGEDGRFDYRVEVIPLGFAEEEEEESGFFDHGEASDEPGMPAGIPGFFGNDLFIA